MHHLDLKSGHFLDLVHMLSGVRFLQFLSQAHLGFAAALASSSPLFVGWSSYKYVLKGVKSLPLVNGNWYDYVIDEHDNLLKHGSSNIFDNSEIEISVESCKVEISIFYVYV